MKTWECPEQARAIVCRHNMKEYGVAGRMCLNDKDASFPYSFS